MTCLYILFFSHSSFEFKYGYKPMSALDHLSLDINMLKQVLAYIVLLLVLDKFTN